MDNQHDDLKYTVKTKLFCPLPYEAAKAIVEALDDKIQSHLEYDEVRLSEDALEAKEDDLSLLHHDSGKSH